MEKIKGYQLGKLPIPIGSLTKVSDLIEFDGPVLSHFTDEKNKHYIFYWVDHDQQHNRWLIWKIDKDQLYSFLKKQLSLKELLLKPNKDFIYAADIDADLNYKSVYAIDLDEMNVSYVPEESEYFAFNVPVIYDSLIASFETDHYLQLLRESALYFKWNTRSDAKRFSETVGAADAGAFLTKISKSFLKYMEFQFFEGFKIEITDLKRMNKIISQFRDILQPRLVDSGYGSFKVALSSDTVNSVNDSNGYKIFQNTIMERYRNDVIDVDYSSQEDLKIIQESFPAEVRKEIFGPIISIINDDQYQLEVVDYQKTFKRKYTKVSRQFEDLILPVQIPEVVDEEQKRMLFTFVIEGPQRGTDQFKISKKLLQDNTLFSQQDESVPLFIDQFLTEGSLLELKEKIPCKLILEGKMYILESKLLDIRVEEDSRDRVWAAFNKAVFDFFELATYDLDPESPDVSARSVYKDKYFPMIKSIQKAV